MGYLQPHAPLRSLCGFFAGWLCFRRGHAELRLHIERILRGERQHSRLGVPSVTVPRSARGSDPVDPTAKQ